MERGEDEGRKGKKEGGSHVGGRDERRKRDEGRVKIIACLCSYLTATARLPGHGAVQRGQGVG